jgi:trans-aconitate methyltransferase
MRLNLGCCDRHLPGFCNVDLAPPADLIADLQDTWPWSTGSVEQIIANDILEHLPDKIHTMNETYRVLEPGGVVALRVPTTDGRGAFQDPTHCSFWSANDLRYYRDGAAERERFGEHYGIAAKFEIVSEQHEEFPEKVWYLTATMRAVK